MSKSRAEVIAGPEAESTFSKSVRDGRTGLVLLRREADVSVTVFANAAALSLLGCAAAEELPAGDPFGPCDPEDGSWAIEEVTLSHRDGRAVIVDAVFCERAEDGSRIVLLAEPGGVIDRDVLFRRLVEDAPDGVAVTHKGELRYLNGAAARLLGFDHPRDLVGRRITEFLDDDGRRSFSERAGRIGPGPGALSPLEYRTQRRDRSWIIAEITSLPIQWNGEDAVVAFARDVTERSRIAEQLKRADRLASLGTLSAGVAHEINNPLTFMTLGIELLVKRLHASGLDEDELGAMLSTLAEIRRGADRVAEIVRDLRTFSRGDAQSSEPVDVRAAVESAHRMVDHRARHLAAVVMDVPELPLVVANASRLEQVFVNLLLNACQAFEDDRAENRIEIRGGLLDRGRLFIDVIDNGPGIGSEVLPRIFDPFFTTKTVGEGTGLGLAICHGIIARYGGELFVESAPGRTVFRTTLPHAEASTDARVDESEPARSRPRLKILVVDDEPAIVRSLRRSLAARHDVSTSTSFEEATAALSASAFDVVLCDLAMPSQSGMDLYEWLRATRPELLPRFAVMTGGAVSPRARRFLEEWTGPRIDKPFSARKLEHLLAETMGLIAPVSGIASEPPSA